MSVRAVILGLLGAALLCGITFFNDMVMRGTFLVGNFLPITVFGSLILFLMLINPLLALLGRRAPFTGRELSLIVALVLFACYIPGRGLMHQFTTFLMLPHHYERTTPGWQGEPARITPEQVPEPAALETRVRDMIAQPAGDVQALLAAHLPAGATEAAALIEALNGAIESDALGAAVGESELPLPGYAEKLRAKGFPALDEAERHRLTRAVVDVALEGVLVPRKPGVLEHVHPRLLADPTEDSTVPLDGFVNGLATGDESIRFSAVPWHAWRRTLLFWLPLITTVCFALIGLSLIIHRQWATHERLPYPTVEFARALLPEGHAARSPMFRNRLFWIGTVLVFAVHMNNYAHVWWPDYLVPVRLRFDFYPILEVFPIFRRSGVGIWTMFNPFLYFTVIGFAYFLATDVSLSLGVAPYAYAVFTGILAGYGISVNGAFLQPYPGSFFYAGAYTAMFLVLVYTGRQYYSSVCRRGLGLSARDDVEPSAVWGVRVFALGMLCFAAQLVIVGLEWPLAVLYALVMVILCVVISRLLAEAGVFYLHAYFFPCAVLWGFLGARAIGPDQLLIMSMLSSVLLIDPREAFMPYAVSGIQLADRARLRLGRAATLGYVALLLGLAAAVPATLYLQYQHGAIRAGDGWTHSGVPKFALNATSQVRSTLSAQGVQRLVDQRGGCQRLADARPMAPCLAAFATTFVLVLLFTACRHRFAWWPIHPLLFLVLATWQSRILAFSFLIGWFIKRCVTKYGGAKTYQNLKPLMIGLVTGEMVAGLVPMIIGAVYYQATGEPPKSFAIYR